MQIVDYSDHTSPSLRLPWEPRRGPRGQIGAPEDLRDRIDDGSLYARIAFAVEALGEPADTADTAETAHMAYSPLPRRLLLTKTRCSTEP